MAFLYAQAGIISVRQRSYVQSFFIKACVSENGRRTGVNRGAGIAKHRRNCQPCICGNKRRRTTQLGKTHAVPAASWPDSSAKQLRLWMLTTDGVVGRWDIDQSIVLFTRLKELGMDLIDVCLHPGSGQNTGFGLAWRNPTKAFNRSF
jgi:hypothetical protein